MSKSRSPWILAAAIATTLGSAGEAAAIGLVCEPTKLSFRTTQWLNPVDFNLSVTNPDSSVTLGKVETSLGTDKTPATVLLPAEGGVISKTLEIAPGFKIKKALICAKSPESLPLAAPVAGLTVTLNQSLPTPTVTPLAFQRMATSAPGCAVYRVVDELGNPAHAVDPRLSPTTLAISVPPALDAEITGIGLRLQAVASSPLWTFVPYHEHAYLTGRGVGHNNTIAVTSGPSDECLDEATLFAADADDIVDFTPELPVIDPTNPKPGKGGKGKGKGKGKK